jgi:hypothetical protein
MPAKSAMWSFIISALFVGTSIARSVSNAESLQITMGGYFDEPETLPALNLSLKPLFSDDTPTAINVTMRLRDPHSSRFKNGTALLALLLVIGPTPTARYDGKDDIYALDDEGILHLTYKDGKDPESPRHWFLDRDAMGDIVVKFTAPYRETDENTPAGPRIDLRLDPGGGLIGQGLGFIPVPPPFVSAERRGGGPSEGSKPSLDNWDVTLNWDLSLAPDGTKGASSLGDAQSIRTNGSLDELITHCIFAVGPLQRYPSWSSPSTEAQDRYFAMYWLGTPPFDMDDMAQASQSHYNAIADYFSSPDPFRVFVRKVSNGHGGTGATMSFMIEYDDLAVEEMTPLALQFLLAHETVHEYALMEETEESLADVWWYDEGVADYIAAIAGYTGGGWSKASMVETLNNDASAYYTSPALHLSLEYVTKHAWENIHVMRVMYNRGSMFLVRLNGLIVEATEGQNDLSEVIQELYHRRVKGDHYRIDEFREMVRAFIGKGAEQAEYDALHRGDLLVPVPATFSKLGLKTVRKDAEKFELGFDVNSMRTNKVTGLIKGSRADLAGVREGDDIVGGYMVWGVADSLNNMMQVTVKRDGEEKIIKFWPRSYEKVECYMWVDENEENDEL